MRIGRILFGPRIEPIPDPAFDSLLARMIEGAKAKHYADGMRDGVILALETLLGVSEHGDPPPVELPAELRAWAETALQHARERP